MSRLERIGDVLHPGAWLIQADAGTGKTYTITNLVVFLVAREDVPIENILAVTYTKAATAELRERIRERLRQAMQVLQQEPTREGGIRDPAFEELRDCTDDERRRRVARLERARGDLDRATISTIHSFCQLVLGTWPEYTGHLAVEDFLETPGELVEELVDDYLTSKLFHKPAAAADTLALCQSGGLKREQLIKLGTQVIAKPAAVISLGGTGDHPRREFVQWIRQKFRKRLHDYRLLTYDELLQRVAQALRGDDGLKLAKELRRAWPAVLVDEFQDTDMVQWDIFEHGWLGDGNNVYLYLVGDPKQSIYGFRGADVYVSARAQEVIRPERRVTLDVNWRSDQRYLEALNRLYLAAEPGGELPAKDHEVFGFREDFVSFHPARVPPGKVPERRSRIRDPAGRPLRAMSIRWLGDRLLPASAFSSKGKVARVIPRLVAADIVRLLESGAQINRADDGGRPGWLSVAPSDIAVLVRTNDQAAAIAGELRKLDVAAVTSLSGSVFASEAARMVSLWLEALVEPASSRAARALAVMPLFAFRAWELDKLTKEPPGGGKDPGGARLEQLQADIARWSEQAEATGIIAALNAMLASRWPQQARFFSRPDAERLLTDLRHLGELLHKARIRQRLGLGGLRQWLQRQRQNSTVESEAAEIRLDTDEEAVRVLTVHKAKGLEFPIVFLPYFWAGSGGARKGDVFSYHECREGDYPLHIWAGMDAPKETVRKRRRESLQEDMRLLYVALTRARHQCVLYYGVAGSNVETSPAGLLLLRDRGEPLETTGNRLKPAKPGRKRGDDQWCENGKRLFARLAQHHDEFGDGLIEVSLVEKKDLQCEPYRGEKPEKGTRPVLQARSLDNLDVSLDWRVHSFSELAGAARDEVVPPEEREKEHDDPDSESLAAEAEAPADEPVFLERLGAGRRVGDWVHEVLELVDFSSLRGSGAAGKPPPGLMGLVAESGRRHGIDGEQQHRLLARQLPLIMRTDVGEPLAGLTLADIGNVDRLCELDFSLPLAGGTAWSRRQGTLDRRRFLDLVRKALPGQLGQELGWEDKPLDGALAGLLVGKIDLVFRAEANGRRRYFLADYKSNRLGRGRPDDYTEENLLRAMNRHHYLLQLVIYTLALHRFLQSRLAGYSYQRDFGGAYYFFVRGMIGPGCPPGQGVFFVRPRGRFIEKLSALLDGGGNAALPEE